MRRRALASEIRSVLPLVPLVLALLAGCATHEDGQPVVPSALSSKVRQVDDSGRTLPFQTSHSRRWNGANDGTVYEPCTAVGLEELARLSIDPTTATDAAGTDGQTLRGCRWRYITGKHSGWSIAQFVGNSASLAADKAKFRSGDDIWLADLSINGRVVGLHRSAQLADCDTYVQSGRAGVHTVAMYVGPTPPPPSEICDRALAFTRATISKMPL